MRMMEDDRLVYTMELSRRWASEAGLVASMLSDESAVVHVPAADKYSMLLQPLSTAHRPLLLSAITALTSCEPLQGEAGTLLTYVTRPLALSWTVGLDGGVVAAVDEVEGGRGRVEVRRAHPGTRASGRQRGHAQAAIGVARRVAADTATPYCLDECGAGLVRCQPCGS